MKLSIITINRNNAAGLEKTIRSVVCQTYTDFEYIIIDGNSDDGSVDVIKKFANKITYWVSEPDSGIYNAMNKGIRKAQGEYCLFLNSGDCLLKPATLQNVFEEITGLDDAGIYYSDGLKNDGSIQIFPDCVNINHLLNSTLNHQNTLIKCSLFHEHEYYNENLKIASDWEFFLNELWTYKTKFVHIKTNISLFDASGIGSSNTAMRRLENKTVFKNVFPELSSSIIELRNYHESVYYDIIKNYGSTKILSFLLRLYRFVVKQLKGKYK
jgi:glycosyltransferase involved in cell wall biosynthesis